MYRHYRSFLIGKFSQPGYWWSLTIFAKIRNVFNGHRLLQANWVQCFQTCKSKNLHSKSSISPASLLVKGLHFTHSSALSIWDCQSTCQLWHCQLDRANFMEDANFTVFQLSHSPWELSKRSHFRVTQQIIRDFIISASFLNFIQGIISTPFAIEELGMLKANIFTFHRLESKLLIVSYQVVIFSIFTEYSGSLNFALRWLLNQKAWLKLNSSSSKN